MKRVLLFGSTIFAALLVASALAEGDKPAGGSCPATGCAKKCCGAASTVALEEGAKKDPLADAKCPISGGKVSKDATAAYKGGKVYFCCGGCPAKFEKDQAKYATKANLQLVQTGQAKQKGCPLSGGKLDSGTKTTVCGVDVAFCCSKCQAKVTKADAEKQSEMVFGKNFDKAFEVTKK